MIIQTLTEFNKIIDSYNIFFIDIWGTLHDGKNVFPGVMEFINTLTQKKKEILLLSNTPRPNPPICSLNTSLGLFNTIPHPCILTSGDLFLNAVKKDSFFQQPYYFIGTPGLHDIIIESLKPYPVVKNLKEASYVLCTSATENCAVNLAEALALNLPLVCTNPDLSVVENGSAIPCPGSLAKEYAEKGGQVFYFGKPYQKMYEHAFAMMGNPPKENVLMVGDGLYTDVYGASQYGIDCLFVNTGVHSNVLNPQDWSGVHTLCKKLNINPTYYLSSFFVN